MSIPLHTRVVLVNAMNHTGETGTVVWVEGRKHNDSLRYTVRTDTAEVFVSESQIRIPNLPMGARPGQTMSQYAG